jgi:NAD(P)-dependent dehydrogenase (short-subunit alcohol dehydrogenase family)
MHTNKKSRKRSQVIFMDEAKQNKYNNPFQATVTGILNLFRKQEKVGELTQDDRLDGKTVIVDGASSGLGFAVVTELAKRGAKVIMVCRTGIPKKGEIVKRRSGSKDIYMLHVDFADIHSIQKLVSEVLNHFAPIDILVSNAGIVARSDRMTGQGVDEMFMVNYLSKYLFVRLLLQNNCFRDEENNLIPRIIFVSSETHRNPREFDWDAFGINKPYTMGKSVEMYGYYKLLLTTFASELSRRLNRNGRIRCSVFALCPGPVNSNIGREAPVIFRPLMKLVFAVFFRSPSKAAMPVAWLAASKDVEGKPFDYLFLMSRKEIDGNAADQSNGQRLWELSENLVNRLGIRFFPF